MFDRMTVSRILHGCFLVNAFHSATVKVSDTDYWSERMAEYTGKPNRVVFDETLERVYKQLYDNSTTLR